MVTFSVNINQYDVMETLVSKTDMLDLITKDNNYAEVMSDIYIKLNRREILEKAKSKSGNLKNYIITTAIGMQKSELNRQTNQYKIVEDEDEKTQYTISAAKLQTPDFTDSMVLKLKNEDTLLINEFLNTREYIYLETGRDIYRLIQLLKTNMNNDKVAKNLFLDAAAKMQELASKYIGLKENVVNVMADDELLTKIEDILGLDNYLDQLKKEEIKWVI